VASTEPGVRIGHLVNTYDTQWYNTEAGIRASLGSLADLNRMTQARHTAGYERKERLTRFILLGRFLLDSCGNLMRCVSSSNSPAELVSNFPDVILADIGRQLIDTTTGKESMVSFGIGESIPPANVVCPECGEGWTVENCHDTSVKMTNTMVDFSLLVGLTLAQVREGFKQRSDAVWRLIYDMSIQNDRFIDLTPDPKYPSLKVNQRGWVGTHEGIDDTYVIQPGDSGSFNVWRYYHTKCNRQKLHTDTKQYFREILKKAGFTDYAMRAIRNKYCPRDVCTPWFNINTQATGRICIGWRNRVINIDWSDSDVNLQELFEQEDVTKGPHFIHAWSKEDAIAYLIKIREALTAVHAAQRQTEDAVLKKLREQRRTQTPE